MSTSGAQAVAVGVSETRRLGDFADLMQHLREPGWPPTVISPRRFGEALNVDLQTIAAWAHVHRNTVQRAPGSDAVQAYLRDALRIICAVMDSGDGVEAALFWFRNHPIRDFDRKTADHLVADGKTEAVLGYLATLEVGASG